MTKPFSEDGISLLTIWRCGDDAILKGRDFVVDHMEMW